MKQLRKKYTILGLVLMSIESAICMGFKITYKQYAKRQRFYPYNIADSLRNNNSSISAIKRISNTLLQKGMLDNGSCASSSMNNRPMQTDGQALDLSNPIKRPYDKDNNTTCSNNIEEVYYMNVDNTENNIDNFVPDITQKSIIDLTSTPTSELTPSTTINPLKVDSNSGLVITNALYFCAAKNQFIIRNYTSYIETPENALVANYNGWFKYKKVNQKIDEIIKSLKSDIETDIWTMIKNTGIKFLLLKTIFQKIIKLDFYAVQKFPNPLCYDGFLDDLVGYIKKHGQVIIHHNNNVISLHVNKRIETLGDVWINKEVSLYCCCCGINSQIVTEGTKKNIKLKKKLNTILLIPEIYEDFYKISESVVNKFFSKLKKEIMNRDTKNKSNDIVGSADDLKIEQLPDLTCIMKYLIHTAQKNEASAEEAYNAIKQIKLHGGNENLIGDSNAIEVYNFVCNKVGIFYKYHGMAYKLYQKQKGAIRNRTRLIHINNMNKEQPHNKILGEDSLKIQKLFKSTANIQNIDKIENRGPISSIDIENLDYAHTFSENSIILRIKDHYHVQFVDNEWHTVTMVHIPYYMHKQKNGTIINY
ncbi:hypothetical protein NEPAR04_2538, partial [Nematocida parisii]